jgi:hypothetical protein
MVIYSQRGSLSFYAQVTYTHTQYILSVVAYGIGKPTRQPRSGIGRRAGATPILALARLHSCCLVLVSGARPSVKSRLNWTLVSLLHPVGVWHFEPAPT